MTRTSKLLIAAVSALVLAAVLAAPARPQISNVAPATPRADTMPPAYDVAKEVKIQGTIQKTDSATAGLTGTHIFLQTSDGLIDAHLGLGPASRPQYLGIAPGQTVTVIGMMQSLGSANVLLARILTTSNHIFVLRNEHGIPVRGTPRGTTSAKTLQKGM